MNMEMKWKRERLPANTGSLLCMFDKNSAKNDKKKRLLTIHFLHVIVIYIIDIYYDLQRQEKHTKIRGGAHR